MSSHFCLHTELEVNLIGIGALFSHLRTSCCGCLVCRSWEKVSEKQRRAWRWWNENSWEKLAVIREEECRFNKWWEKKKKNLISHIHWEQKEQEVKWAGKVLVWNQSVLLSPINIGGKQPLPNVSGKGERSATVLLFTKRGLFSSAAALSGE